MEEINKGRKFLYRTSERLEGKYSKKKENYYNEEVNKRKAPRSKDLKKEKKEEEKSSKKMLRRKKKEWKGKALKKRIQKNLRGQRIMKKF